MAQRLTVRVKFGRCYKDKLRQHGGKLGTVTCTRIIDNGTTVPYLVELLLYVQYPFNDRLYYQDWLDTQRVCSTPGGSYRATAPLTRHILFSYHKPADRAIPIALHPWHDAMLMKHVVARRNCHKLFAFKVLQANRAFLPIFVLQWNSRVTAPWFAAAKSPDDIAYMRVVKLLPQLVNSLLLVFLTQPAFILPRPVVLRWRRWGSTSRVCIYVEESYWRTRW